MVDTNIKHGTFVPKQNHKHPYGFCLKESADPGGVRRLHKYNLWHFNLWPIKSDLNIDSINVWVAMLRKDMELEYEENLS